MKQAVCLTVAFAATSSGAPGYGPAAGEPTGRASRLPRDPLQNPVMTDDRRWGDVRHASEHERSEEHTSELQSRLHLVCRLLLEKKKKGKNSREALQTSCTPSHSYPLTRRLCRSTRER